MKKVLHRAPGLRLSALALIGLGLVADGAYAGVADAEAWFKEGRCQEASVALLGPARGGDAKAQKILGDIYMAGTDCPDVEYSAREAERWYLLAANKGEPAAQSALGSLYGDFGALENPSRALFWLRRAAPHGVGTDLAALGRIYESGAGAPADRVLSYMLQLLSLDSAPWLGQGEVQAYLPVYAKNMSPDQIDEAQRLARQWRRGTPLPETSVSGRRSPRDGYRGAAEAGDPDAAFKLGMLYLKGAGDEDQRQAAYWLRRAAESGNPEAQLQLARLYGMGVGVAQDYVLAAMLSQLADKGGAPGAGDVASGWTPELTAAQSAEALALAQGWHSGTPLPLVTRHGAQRKHNYAQAPEGKLAAAGPLLALFDAASEGDEAAFSRLLAGVPDPGAYQRDGWPLLHTLLRPAASLVAEQTAWRGAHPSGPDMAQRQLLRQRHSATQPARLRMLALLLGRGVAVGEGSGGGGAIAPLHLAAMYGDAAMVRLLLAHGADVRQYGGENSLQTALEYALDQGAAGNLPELISAQQRTDNLIALLNAGAGLPYGLLDQRTAQRTAREEQAGATKKDGPARRPSADYLVWPDLVALTRGAPVLDKMLATGTTPYGGENDDKSLFAYAAEAGNSGALDWLKRRVPRYDTNSANRVDRWLDAAMRAMYIGAPQSDQVLSQLLVAGMPWSQIGPVEQQTGARTVRHADAQRLEQGTLLWHAVRNHRADWVGKLAALGAPLDGAAARQALLQAVTDGDAALVTLLLGLGVDALAGDEPVLTQALKLQPTPQNNAVLGLLLARIAQRQPLAGIAPSPLEQVLDSVRSAADLARVRLMVEAGLPASRISIEGAVNAMQSPQRELVPFLLDHGMLAHGADAPRAPSDAVLLQQAARRRRADLMPRLLDLGLDPDWRASDEMSALDYAIRGGDAASLRILLERGARIDTASAGPWGGALDLAVASRDTATLALVTHDFSLPLNQVCMPDTLQLMRTVMQASDAYWDLLLKHGFASAPQSCAPAMAPRLVTRFVTAPDQLLVGWLGRRLAARLPQLAAGQRQLDARVWERMRSDGRDDLLAILAAGGWPPPTPALAEAAPLKKPSAADLALQKRLPGSYALQRQREAASSIVLRTNGRFSYQLIYGADDEAAQGRWSVVDGTVLLQGDSVTAQPLFVLQEPRAQDATSGPLEIIVEIKQRPVPGVRLVALGDAPLMAEGVSGEQPWRVPFAAPLRQLVLSHPELDDGRITVIETQRQGVLRFTPQAPAVGMPGFKAVLAVDGEGLTWRRGGTALSYARSK